MGSQFIPGTASLVEELDKTLLVQLRDGRNLVGVLRSFDQFANLVLEDTYERHVVKDKYGDIPLGLYIVRGENVVLLGEIDTEQDAKMMHRVSVEEILALVKDEKDEKEKEEKEKDRRKILEMGEF